MRNSLSVAVPRRVSVLLVVGLVLAAIASIGAVSAQADGPNRDISPPRASILSPTSGEIVSGTVTVSIYASDNVAVVDTGVRVDDVALPLEPGSTRVSWDTTGFSDGNHFVELTVVDSSGNRTVRSISVYVSNNATTCHTCN